MCSLRVDLEYVIIDEEFWIEPLGHSSYCIPNDYSQRNQRRNAHSRGSATPEVPFSAGSVPSTGAVLARRSVRGEVRDNADSGRGGVTADCRLHCPRTFLLERPVEARVRHGRVGLKAKLWLTDGSTGGATVSA